ncbi:hypothetical protein GCM10008935_02180 [Alkalibacillus silvisoli]|uniref:Uncharacterized protein n=1 Tax=Alkalibacillus silvisoli TaxID=392823 RepID=A0ABP3JHX9_9BACI
MFITILSGVGSVAIVILSDNLTIFLLWIIGLHVMIYSLEGAMEWWHDREKREYIVIWSLSAVMIALLTVFYYTEFFDLVPEQV